MCDKYHLKMNASEYKNLHEKFMSNNLGAGAIQTISYITFTVLSTLLGAFMSSFECLNETKFRYFYEYMFIVVPLIFAFTLWADYIYYLILSVVILFVILFVTNWNNIKLLHVLKQPNVSKHNQITAITCMRGLTYLATVFCILAVDFPVFPRYMAKTEQYGFSVMDTGVGLFVLISGLVHKDFKVSIKTVFTNNLKLICILLFLGMSRFFIVQKLNYQQHVTEYGVHWNFFYTLAISKTISSFLIYYIRSSKYLLLTSLLICVIHELLLYFGVQAWVFSDTPRDTFLNANREGIASCLGYISLYIFAAYLKAVLSNKSVLRLTIIKKLLLMVFCISCLLYIINIYRPISRTLTNLSYCLYLKLILLINFLIIYVFELFFQTLYPCPLPLIISALNFNGLLFFLFGNVLTGLINLTIRTLFANAFVSITILNVYIITTIYFAIYLQRRGIKF